MVRRQVPEGLGLLGRRPVRCVSLHVPVMADSRYVGVGRTERWILGLRGAAHGKLEFEPKRGESERYDGACASARLERTRPSARWPEAQLPNVEERDGERAKRVASRTLDVEGGDRSLADDSRAGSG